MIPPLKPKNTTMILSAKFQLGIISSTPGVIQTVNSEDAYECLCRHESGDWGDVAEEQHLENDTALVSDSRLLSVYRDRQGVEFWIITEWDRYATTIALPSEY